MTRRSKATTNRAGGEEPPARPRGRPRSAQADNAIAGAVLALLPKLGFEGMSMEAVAAEAGVSKATLYRRAKSKEDLIVDVLAGLRPPAVEIPDTGSFAGDVAALNAASIGRQGISSMPKVMPRLLTDDDPRIRELAVKRVIQPLRDVIESLAQRAIERGELREDVDRETLIDILHGTVIYTLLTSGGNLKRTVGVPERVIEMLSDGITQTSPRRARSRK